VNPKECHAPAAEEMVDTIKQRNYPAFDYQAELDASLKMREEYQSVGEKGYNRA